MGFPICPLQNKLLQISFKDSFRFKLPPSPAASCVGYFRFFISNLNFLKCQLVVRAGFYKIQMRLPLIVTRFVPGQEVSLVGRPELNLTQP